MLPFHRRFPLFALIAAASFASLSTPWAHSQVASWVAPISGFYETGANWDPVGVPDVTDTVVFGVSGAYDIGLTGAHGAA
ncbi:MAG: hypothetical protein AAF961_13780, partial [Planctomycetota bacterium]